MSDQVLSLTSVSNFSYDLTFKILFLGTGKIVLYMILSLLVIKSNKLMHNYKEN